MRVLVACKESQVVCIAFRELGHEAFSCDILPCSGGRPEWHYQRDVFEVYYKALIEAKTKEERSTIRSKTFPGIAKAMAEQWENLK